MKSLAAAGLIGLSVVSAASDSAFAQATDPSDSPISDEMTIARQIVEIGYPPERREELFFTAMDSMTAQVREAVLSRMEPRDDGAISILDSWIESYSEDSKVILRRHIPAIVASISQSYVNLFDEQELRDILAFVSTPSGQAFFNRSSEILSDPAFAEANKAYMSEIMQEMPQRQAELKSQLEEYFATKGTEGG